MTTKTTKKTTAPRAVPAGAKLPDDRKPKQEKDDGFLRATVRGEEWVVDKDVLDDFELLDDLNALDQREDATRMPSVLRRVLGDQWGKAMDLLRSKETGRVSIEDGTTFVWELMEALNPNSSRS